MNKAFIEHYWLRCTTAFFQKLFPLVYQNQGFIVTEQNNTTNLLQVKNDPYTHTS